MLEGDFLKKLDVLYENRPKTGEYLIYKEHGKAFRFGSKYNTLFTGFEIELYDSRYNSNSYANLFHIEEGKYKEKKVNQTVNLPNGQNITFSTTKDAYKEHENVVAVYNDGSVPVEIVTRPFASNEFHLLEDIYTKCRTLQPDFIARGKSGAHITLLTAQHMEMSSFDPIVVKNFNQLTRAYLPALGYLFGRTVYEIPAGQINIEEMLNDLNVSYESYAGMTNRVQTQMILDYQKTHGIVKGTRRTNFRFYPEQNYVNDPLMPHEKYSVINARTVFDPIVENHKIWAIEVRFPDSAENPNDLILETQFWHALLQFCAKASNYGEFLVKNEHLKKIRGVWDKYESEPIPSSLLEEWKPFALDLIYLIRRELEKAGILTQILDLYENPVHKCQNRQNGVNRKDQVESIVLKGELQGLNSEQIIQLVAKDLNINQSLAIEEIENCMVKL